ncbi:MAG: hypothetical protein ACR2HR_12305 [Euzebya sp.]
MAELRAETAPSLGRDALSGRLELALVALDDVSGPAAAWQRGWILTAVGRYGEALSACAQAQQGPPMLQASALMVQAMLYRQISLHDRAETADEEALAVLRRGRVRSASVRAAIRVGQVADAVGLALDQTVLTRRLRIAAAAVTAAGSWRQGVRLTWVRGEVLMVRGDFSRASRVFAAGAKVASGQGARRHHAKSLIFLAASLAAAGDVNEAARMAERGLRLAARCGASPLIWPAELILAEVDPERHEAHLARARQFAAGVLETLPAPLQAEALQRTPADWLVGDSRSEPASVMNPATDA